MKIAVRLPVIVVLVLCLSSCSALSEIDKMIATTKSQEYGETVFDIPEYGIQVTMPSNWNEKSDSPYDLYCTNGSAYVGIFAFYSIDLADGQSPATIFTLQRDDILEKRDTVKVVDDSIIISSIGKSITSELYSAEHSGNKNYYYCCLVEFTDNPDVFLWMLFTSLPSYAESNMEMFQAIVTSSRITFPPKTGSTL